MPYAPPLIKPPPAPLRPPVAPPFRPPGNNPLRPVFPFPIYQPPDLLPPTSLDLKGIVCIYSNAPIWELKKIRYRYPGESWQEIMGDRYSCIPLMGGYNQIGKVWLSGKIKQCFEHQTVWDFTNNGSGIGPIKVTGKVLGVDVDYVEGDYGGLYTVVHLLLETAPNTFKTQSVVASTRGLSESACYTEDTLNPIADHLDKTTNTIRITRYEGEIQYEFKVFDIFDQEILSITRDVCPQVIVVPERCYFKAENERLVARWIIGFGDPPLRVEYQGNCATVWKDFYPDFGYKLQIYKECSDNPNCPPPRIRFDKKCEETCEQCPPGTAIKVLLGNQIACVDASGCIKEMIQYKPGCNSYDCICG